MRRSAPHWFAMNGQEKKAAIEHHHTLKLAVVGFYYIVYASERKFPFPLGLKTNLRLNNFV